MKINTWFTECLQYNYKMDLKEFIEKYDIKGNVILLEGKREIKDCDKEKLLELGKLITDKTKNVIFRSGNANGADNFFSLGVSLIDSKRLQIIVPYNKHRVKYRLTDNIISLENLDIKQEKKLISESKKNLKMSKLIDDYVNGNINRYSINLHILSEIL